MPNKNLFTAIKRSTRNTGGSSFMPAAGYKPLYNGNISAMAVNIGKLNTPMLYNYQYDQLNRIVAMDAFTGLNQSTNKWNQPLSATTNYQERISYDANGNILTYQRNGDAARLNMDNLTYTYKPGTNQLDKVTDAAPDAAAGEYDKYKDIKQGQQNGNYRYDANWQFDKRCQRRHYQNRLDRVCLPAVAGKNK